MTPLILATRAHLRHELGREPRDAEMIERLAEIATAALEGMSWGYGRLPAMKPTRAPKEKPKVVEP